MEVFSMDKDIGASAETNRKREYRGFWSLTEKIACFAGGFQFD
ncbi:hypothetical protein QUF72_04230 [Desulfobacterales bacterium HSG2]|nr:hypothetical protein [Desulfobacterales bacterium HSG2]